MIESLAIVPHGEEIIDPKDQESKKLKNAMAPVVRNFEKSNLDTIVLFTPHNIRMDDHFAIILTEYASGNLGKRRLSFKCDRDLSMIIYKNAKDESLPVVGVNFGALEGKSSRIYLDWGSFIPLYFLNKKHKKILLITPARGVERNVSIKFGELIGKVLKNNEKKIGVIVSADQAHTHLESGPYGYSPYAKIFDERIIEILKKNDFESLKNIDEKIIEDAKPDSYWSFLILLGILRENSNFRLEYFQYALPSYFGMLVGLFKKIE